VNRIFKAFVTGFVTVSVLLLLLQLFLPLLGVSFELGWNPTFTMRKSGPLHASWFTPIVVGLVFAFFEAAHLYKDFFHHDFKLKVKDKRFHDAWVVAWHGLWGVALGFVATMLLLSLSLGDTGIYSIPFLFKAKAGYASVVGTSNLISLGGLLGLAYGYWVLGLKKKHSGKK
jgi:hypothetical protein